MVGAQGIPERTPEEKRRDNFIVAVIFAPVFLVVFTAVGITLSQREKGDQEVSARNVPNPTSAVLHSELTKTCKEIAVYEEMMDRCCEQATKKANDKGFTSPKNAYDSSAFVSGYYTKHYDRCMRKTSAWKLQLRSYPRLLDEYKKNVRLLSKSSPRQPPCVPKKLQRIKQPR